MNYNTLAVHGGNQPEQHGAVNFPVYFATTYTQPDTEHEQFFMYSRSKNPTRYALERLVADLEGAKYAFALSSGMAANSLVFELLQAGNRILMAPHVYGGTWLYASELFARRGVEPVIVRDLNKVDFDTLDPAVKMVFIETPSNPLLEVTDIARIAKEAKKHGILTVVDNTFLTSYLQRPLELGADIVVYSGTKYYGGHSDVLAGLIVTNSDELYQRFYLFNKAHGAPLAPLDAFLLSRGIRTLPLRIARQTATAGEIARWLERHEGSRIVHYPGLAGHPGYEIQQRQAKGAGGLLSFELDETKYDLKRFVGALKLFAFAVSLGGVESLICRPATQTHESYSKALQEEIGIKPNLLRLGVGVEDPADLIADLDNAFKASRIA